uniref:Uncharacterized protein n=1 Tax=Grammatophora oceanica TaxID=210454 RepID=A0A7S1YCR3_9STRA
MVDDNPNETVVVAAATQIPTRRDDLLGVTVQVGGNNNKNKREEMDHHEHRIKIASSSPSRTSSVFKARTMSDMTTSTVPVSEDFLSVGGGSSTIQRNNNIELHRTASMMSGSSSSPQHLRQASDGSLPIMTGVIDGIINNDDGKNDQQHNNDLFDCWSFDSSSDVDSQYSYKVMLASANNKSKAEIWHTLYVYWPDGTRKEGNTEDDKEFGC